MKRRIAKKRVRDSRRYQLYLAKVVDFDCPERESHAAKTGKPLPFHDGDTVLVLGEVERMPGHVAVVTQDGKVHYAWHTENFQRLPEEEI